MPGINHNHVVWFPDEAAGTVRLGDREVPRAVRAEVGDPTSGDPQVRVYVEVVGDKPQCRAITFDSVPRRGAWMMDSSGREVRQGDLDAFRIAEWIERIFVLSVWPTYATNDDFLDDRPVLREELAAARKPRNVDRAFLKQVADIYRRNIDDNPTETIRVHYGTSYRTAARYVERARKDDLLPKTSQGKRKA